MSFDPRIFSILIFHLAHPEVRNMKKSNTRLKEHEVLTKHWGLVKQAVVLHHIVDPLIENSVLTVDQWMDLKNRRISEPERMEELLYIMLKSRHDAVSYFLKALKQKGYKHVADELEGKLTTQTATTYIGKMKIFN